MNIDTRNLKLIEEQERLLDGLDEIIAAGRQALVAEDSTRMETERNFQLEPRQHDTQPTEDRPKIASLISIRAPAA